MFRTLEVSLELVRSLREVVRRLGTVDRDLDGATRHIEALAGLGIDLTAVTDKLLTDGLAAFQKSFDTLIAGLERKAAALVASR